MHFLARKHTIIYDVWIVKICPRMRAGRDKQRLPMILSGPDNLQNCPSLGIRAHLIYGSLAHLSQPQTASRSVPPFCMAHENHQRTDTHRQRDHAIPSVAITRMLCNACDES